nr:alpha/beta fold hydrolase [Saprospiraceae bacterium]
MRTIFFIALAALMAFSVNAQTMVKSMKDLDYGVEVKTIKVKGNISVAYTDEGKGAQTLVFIHGLASYLPAWKKNTAVLKDSYRCIALDLPGYGKSDKGNYEVSMEFYADVVAEFCSQLKLSQVVLVGHSMGGQVAISAALKYPELVARLVLIAPAGFETFNKGQRQWFRDVMTADGVRLTTAEQIRINYAYNFYNMPDDAAFMIDDRLAIRSA